MLPSFLREASKNRSTADVCTCSGNVSRGLEPKVSFIKPSAVHTVVRTSLSHIAVKCVCARVFICLFIP